MQVLDKKGNLLYETGQADFTGEILTIVKIRDGEGSQAKIEVSTTQSGLTPLGRIGENFRTVIDFKVKEMLGESAQIENILETRHYQGHDPKRRIRI